MSDNRLFKLDFDGFGSLYRYLSEQRPVNDRAGSLCSPSADWDLDLGFDGACQIAHDGGHWSAGAKSLLKAHSGITAGAVRYQHDIDYDYAGGALDVCEYLAGSDECFIAAGDDAGNQRFCKVAVNCGRAAKVKASEVMRRGGAILGAIDALEGQGIQVSLTAVWASHWYLQRSGQEFGSLFTTEIKRAGEPWSAGAVAFALCHPAMNRRLMFGCAERLEGCTAPDHNYGRAGSSKAARDIIQSKYDVFIDGHTGGEFSTDEQARKFVARHFKAAA